MGTIGGQPHVIAELEVIGEMFEIRVIRSSLEEKHRPVRVLRQAGRKHAPADPAPMTITSYRISALLHPSLQAYAASVYPLSAAGTGAPEIFIRMTNSWKVVIKSVF